MRVTLSAFVVLLIVMLLLTMTGVLDERQSGEELTNAELATELQQQQAAAQTAIDLAKSPFIPAIVGAGVGLGTGFIASAVYAYRNRGMR